MDPLELVAVRIETRAALLARWDGHLTLPAYVVEEYRADGARLRMEVPSLELMQTYYSEMAPPLIWLTCGPGESRDAVIAAIAGEASNPLHWVDHPVQLH